MRGQNVNIRFGGPLTPVVKQLLIINGVVYLVGLIVEAIISPGFIANYFGLSHVGMFENFMVWQIFTYMFIHTQFLHLFFNLLALFMFGGELEQIWGKKLFLRYYLICGLGAGLFIALLNFYLFSSMGVSGPTIGASGAIYGILIAYGLTWPNREVLLFFVIPVKIKYLVAGFGVFSFIMTIESMQGGSGNISHIGHFGGLVTGLVYILWRIKPYQERYISAAKMKDNPLSNAMKKSRVKKKKKDIETRIEAKKIIDDLLEKIARDGMSSLSAKEKKQLEWARRHYYPEDRDTLH